MCCKPGSEASQVTYLEKMFHRHPQTSRGGRAVYPIQPPRCMQAPPLTAAGPMNVMPMFDNRGVVDHLNTPKLGEVYTWQIQLAGILYSKGM
jgi:hypothetical protein